MEPNLKTNKLQYIATYYYICIMKEREIIVYKNYFYEFLDTLKESEIKKVLYVLDMLKALERVSEKFVKYISDGLYEIRISTNGNIYRVFFIFDNGNIVVLFNGFQKKTQKTPKNEIEKAKQIKKDYENERNSRK